MNGFFVIVSDITELKTMEREREAIIANMVESSKLATLGDMAGGVAHEFNTPLAIIISKTESLLRKARQGELEREVVISQLEKIKETSERIAKIVKGLRQFSRISDDDSTHHVSVEATIEATLNLCREKILSTGISLSTQLTPNLEFLGRQSEVAQVLMNLLLNAADAVENGKDRRIEIESNVSDNFVQIAVSDYGHGIPKPILDKIMNPFFSTKEIGKGTGLGLSIAKGIAEAHGGKLVCESRINPTRFVLELPLAPTNSKKSVA